MTASKYNKTEQSIVDAIESLKQNSDIKKGPYGNISRIAIVKEIERHTDVPTKKTLNKTLESMVDKKKLSKNKDSFRISAKAK